MILRGWGIRTTSGYFGLPPFFEFELCAPRWDESQLLTLPSPQPSNPNGGTILAFGAGTHVLLPVTLQELFVRHLSTIHWLPIRVCDISLQVNHHFFKIVVFVLWMMKKVLYFMSFFLGEGCYTSPCLWVWMMGTFTYSWWCVYWDMNIFCLHPVHLVEFVPQKSVENILPSKKLGMHLPPILQKY